MIGTLADLHLHHGRPDLAEPLLRVALEVHREVGNARFEARVLAQLAALRPSEAGR